MDDGKGLFYKVGFYDAFMSNPKDENGNASYLEGYEFGSTILKYYRELLAIEREHNG